MATMRECGSSLFERLTCIRSQRAFLGLALIAMALPTLRTYNFWGSDAMAYLSALGGVVALGLAIINPPLWDRREVLLGGTLMVVFGLRFVVFITNNIKGLDEPFWSWHTHWDLYLGSSALWIHCMMFYIGAVLVRRWVDARYGEAASD